MTGTRKTVLLLQDINESGYTIGDRCLPMTWELYPDHSDFLTLKLK